MKKELIRIISMVLICVISMLTFSSCGIIISSTSLRRPKGYTGGFGITYGSTIEYYWVETYEEVLDAINELESYDSTFSESAFFSYDGELFDTKYCFVFKGKKHSVKKGEKLSERWAEDIELRSYGFFEDVSISELEYSYITDYDVVEFKPTNSFYTLHKEGELVDRDSLTYDLNEYYSISIDKGNICLFKVKRSKEGENIKLNEDCLNAILDSMVFIGKDDTYYDR